MLDLLQQTNTRKVVIIGPESTGKSTLTQQLAAHYHTSFADEYARGYLETLGRPYVQADLPLIAAGQLQLEEQAVARAKHGLTFLDTDLYVIKVWSENKYGVCDPVVLEQIARRRYDLYLLTDIDMLWVDDPLREHGAPEMRQYFFNIYLDLVQRSGTPFAIISGNPEQRLQQAIAVVNVL